MKDRGGVEEAHRRVRGGVEKKDYTTPFLALTNTTS